MSKHKSIPTATRKKLYEKYNHRCAYCGCELEYKDMQIDHVESVYRNNPIDYRLFHSSSVYTIQNMQTGFVQTK